MSQHSSDVHILLYFSIYFQEIFTELEGMVNIYLEAKKNILIDFHYKVTMSETLETVAFVGIV